MPELRFREEEPERSIPVMPTNVRPTISRELELAAVPVSEEAVRDEGRRHESWGAVKPGADLVGPLKLPAWAIALVLALGSLQIVMSAQLVQLAWAAEAAKSVGEAMARHDFVYFCVGVQFVALMFVLGPVLAGLAGQAIGSRRRLARDLCVDTLAEDFTTLSRTEREPVHGELTVAMVLLREGAIYGEDVGYMRFEEGSLSFEGLRTSFSLSKRRLHRVPARSKVQLLGLTGLSQGCVFAYASVEDSFEVQFHPLALEGRERAERQYLWVGEWMRDGRGASVFEVLPPRLPAPEAAKAALRRLAMSAIAVQAALTLTLTYAALEWFRFLEPFAELSETTWVYRRADRPPFVHYAGIGAATRWVDILILTVALWLWIAGVGGLRRGVRAYRAVKRATSRGGG